MAVEGNTRLVLSRRLCCSSTTTHPSRVRPHHHAAVTDNSMYQISVLVGVAGIMGQLNQRLGFDEGRICTRLRARRGEWFSGQLEFHGQVSRLDILNWQTEKLVSDIP